MTAPIEIDVWQGEIAELEVDALIVGANESLFMTAGAAASLKRHGGDAIERAAVDQGPVEPGRAVATAAGSLAAPYVIHAVAVGHDRIADPDRFRAAVRAALALCAPLQVRRAAMALLGAEHGVFAVEEAAELLVGVLMAEAASHGLESVVIATAHAADTRAVGDALARERARVG
jgi:O-acetyl-ADP-ribose deacetylase (regulator of RNase III)